MQMWVFSRASRLAAILLASTLMGQNVSAQSGVGQACGGAQGPNCSVGLFCESDPGQCKQDDPTGTCIVRTEVCTKIYQPICGCDGKTYANDCERIAAAARKDYDGECKSE